MHISATLRPDVRAELRFAVRRLLAAPWTAAAAILAVTLGTGLSIGVFSVAYGVLVRPLIYEHGERLAVVQASTQLARVEDWRRHLATFERLAAYAPEGVVVRGAGDARFVRITYVDDSFFETVTSPPVAGRLLARGDVGVAVVSERYGRAHGTRPSELLGQRLTAGDAALIIVGVLPSAYAFPTEDVEIWMPAAHAKPVAIDRFDDIRRWRFVGRLHAGASIYDARADVQRARDAIEPTDAPRLTGAAAELLHARLVEGARPALLAFGAAAALVWFVSCANLATLLVGRTMARRRELAIRGALGAGRARIASSLFAEAVLLAGAGGALGVVLAAIGVRVIGAWASGFLPRPEEIGVGIPSMIFAVLLALLVSLAATAGTLPAVRRAALALRSDAGVTRQDRRLRGVLLAAQVALVVVLLCGGGLLVRTITSLLHTDLGLDPRGALVSQLVLTAATTFDGAGRWPLVRELVERVRAVPGIRAAGVGSSLPPDQTQLEITVQVDGEDRMHRFALTLVTPGYLDAIGARLRQGRLFEPRDLDAIGPLVVIGESARRAVMRDADVAGRELPFHLPGALRTRARPTVLGVIDDIRYAGLEADAGPAVYVLWHEAPVGQGFLAIRGEGAPPAIAASVRAVMRDLDPTLPHMPIRGIDEVAAHTVADRRLAALLGATLALLTFGVALVGLAGSVVRAVEERRRELAIRGALGATPRRLVRLVLSDVALLVATGVMLGLGGALATSGVLRSLIHGVGAYDVVTLAGVAGLVALGAAAACYLPARRASRRDPASALRGE